MVTAIVPAAGQGRRFAADGPDAPPKMLAPIDGVPMIRRTVASLLEGGVDRCVVVVSTDLHDRVRAALQFQAVDLVVNPDPSRGMFSSIQGGLQAAGDEDVCLVLPGDMPFVQPLTIAVLLAEAAERGCPVVPAYDGHPGHPVVCTPSLRQHLLAAPADARLDRVLALVDLTAVRVVDPGVRRDVDRPADAG